MNLQCFKTSPREITFGRLLKRQYELLPFGAWYNFVAKLHNTSKFWLIRFMDANFFYHSIDDRFIIYKDNHVVHVLVTFSLKSFYVETIHWIFTKFHRNVP